MTQQPRPSARIKKTSTSIDLSALAGASAQRLVLDLDPQGNAVGDPTIGVPAGRGPAVAELVDDAKRFDLIVFDTDNKSHAV